MSKTLTKVIAALGVVAGLGVAALPLSSYAADADLPVTVVVEKTGAGAPECTGTGCTIPGTNDPKGQNVTIKDKDTALSLCQSAVADGAAGAPACANMAGTSATGVTAIPTLAGEVATLTTGPAATPRGWGIKFNAMTGYTASGTMTSMFQPAKNSVMGTYTSSGAVGNQEFGIIVEAEYATNTTPGTYTDTLQVTTTINP